MKRPKNEKATLIEKTNTEKLKRLLEEYDSPGCTQARKKELLKIFKRAQSFSDSVLLSIQKGK